MIYHSLKYILYREIWRWELLVGNFSFWFSFGNLFYLTFCYTFWTNHCLVFLIHPWTRWWQLRTIPRPCWPPFSGWCCMHSTQTRCTDLNIRSQTNISSLVIKITFELFPQSTSFLQHLFAVQRSLVSKWVFFIHLNGPIPTVGAIIILKLWI